MDALKRTKASLVAAADENPPLDGVDGIGGNGLIQGLLPVVERQDGELQLANLGGGSGDGVMDGEVGDADVGDGRAELAEEVLELRLVLVELFGDATLLRGGDGGQGREGEREAHGEEG